jgi:GPH family glycoside/pentoside/hexuronide:cation symporter
MRALASVAAGTGGVYMVQQGVEVATVMAYSIGALTLLVVFGGVALVPSERAEFSGRGGQHPYNAVRDVFANRHARLLLFVFFIESVGVGGISVLTPFVLAYVIGLESMVPVVIGTFMLSSLAAVPLWVRLSGYFEKRHLWLFAMVQSAVGYSLIFWVGEGDWQLMAFSSFLTGTASACSNTLGLALKAEVIDFDEYLTGERKEGVYFAGWSFVQKLAGGVMVAVVGFSLEWNGYVENAADQTQGVKDAIIFLTAGIPLIGYSIGSLAFTRFDLSEAEHARIRAEIDARA